MSIKFGTYTYKYVLHTTHCNYKVNSTDFSCTSQHCTLAHSWHTFAL